MPERSDSHGSVWVHLVVNSMHHFIATESTVNDSMLCASSYITHHTLHKYHVLELVQLQRFASLTTAAAAAPAAAAAGPISTLS